jgi:hypothetical protein
MWVKTPGTARVCLVGDRQVAGESEPWPVPLTNLAAVNSTNYLLSTVLPVVR